MGGKVFYVGKGQNDRIHVHEREARHGSTKNPHKNRTIRKIWNNNEQVVKTVIVGFDTHEEACLLEIALIFLMDGLTNLTNGGDGTVGLVPPGAGKPLSDEIKQKIGDANRGRIHTEEARRHMSEAHKGKPISESARQKMKERVPANKGIPHSEETRRKISEIHKGNKYNLGRSPSEEARTKISKKLKGRHLSEETRQKMKGRVPANKGTSMSVEQRQQISERQKGKYQSHLYTPEANAKKTDALRGRKHSEETRAKLREAWVRRKQRKEAENL
jgi:hypothetical protein